jgi:hypothetical protein
MAEPNETEPVSRQVAELAALADGSISDQRRREAEALVAGSPELVQALDEQRQAVNLVRTATADVQAPAGLRERIAAQRQGSSRGFQWRPSFAGALAVGIAAAVVLIALLLPSGTPGAPGFSAAAALAVRPAVGPAPSPDPQDHRRLEQTVGYEYFPNWSRAVGGRPTGQRVDRLGNRQAVTVFYEWHGRQLAYTIVGAPALTPPGARPVSVNGISIRAVKLNGREVVTWRRGDHTCILSARGVPESRLTRLAGWKPSS